ncbi:MAG TPA: DNA replication/repair protein RecF [Pseudomonadales bacterium]|nr:DNA replication/repair protein RecF [Pseudomonadales bacterium]
MTLLRLEVSNLRNIAKLDIEPHPKLNIIVGANGSGKTSLLESINVLSTARSFRSAKVKSLVKDLSERLVVFGVVEKSGVEHRLGVQKSRSGETLIRVDGATARGAAELAKWFPVQVIGPDIYELVSEGPTVRRQFLDWGLFHVEQFFYPAWSRYQKALEQRNALLKQGVREDSLYLPWESEMIESAAEIDRFRVDQLSRIATKIEAEKVALLPDLAERLSIEYEHGFDLNKTLASQLKDERKSEYLPSSTLHGPHRADFKIKLDRQLAKEILSRGQAKLLSHALRIAQVRLLNEIKGDAVCMLIDDIGAELDKRAQQVFFDLLFQCDAQLFVTTLDTDFAKQMSSDCKLFHVEHGAISEISTATMECQ